MKNLFQNGVVAVIFFMASASVVMGSDAAIDPIREIKAGVKIKGDVGSYGGRVTEPVELTDKKAALKLLPEKVVKGLDFTKVKVLVFDWSGSGRDQLSYRVAESYPEQIFFEYKPGLTRDLRQHRRVFVLRKNVSWSKPKLK